MAGITNFLVIDIRSEEVGLTYIKRKEPLYKINQSKISHNNCEILASKTEPYLGDFNKLNTFLKRFIEVNLIKEPRIIIGIHEYKYSIASIPADIEDINVWFLENTSKFLPEGRPKEEFSLFYEEIRSDDNFKYYSVVITRNDYLNSVIKSCTIDKGCILTALPFPVAFNIAEGEEPSILFDFDKNKISSFIENQRGVNIADSHFINSGEFNQNYIADYLSGIKQTLQSNNTNLDNLGIMANYDVHEIPWLGEVIKNVFKVKQINKDIEKESYQFIIPFLAVKKTISNFETKLNLVNNGSLLPQREIVEKQFVMRFIIAMGVIIMFFLLSSMLFENFITNKLDDQESSISDINQKISQLAIMKKENARLKKNIVNLGMFKNNRIRHSKLLYDLSKVITKRTALTNVNLKNIESGQVVLEISGTAINQKDVAEIISLMESVNSFKDVTLVNSSLSNEQGTNNKNKNFQFNISAKYNAD